MLYDKSMNDVPPPENPEDQPPPPPETAQTSLTAERYEAFMEDVDVLYIPSNTSGRIRFLQTWPAAAQHLFGEELMQFDQAGVNDMDERKRRAELEVEAEARRIDLLEIMQDIDNKIIVKGETQVNFIKDTITTLGVDIASLFFSAEIMQKFGGAPPPMPEDIPAAVEEPVEPAQVQPPEAPEPPPAIEEPLPEPEPTPESVHEDVKPEPPPVKEEPVLKSEDFDQLLSRVPKKKQIKRKKSS